MRCFFLFLFYERLLFHALLQAFSLCLIARSMISWRILCIDILRCMFVKIGWKLSRQHHRPELKRLPLSYRSLHPLRNIFRSSFGLIKPPISADCLPMKTDISGCYSSRWNISVECHRLGVSTGCGAGTLPINGPRSS